MTRLQPLTYQDSRAEQQALWDQLVASRGDSLDLIDDNGSLRGPFHAFVLRPEIGAPLAQVGAAIRFGSTLETRLLEIAICTVGARWKSNFEFWAHRQMAESAGVSADVLDAMAHGNTPPFTHTDEEIVWQFAHELCHEGAVTDATYLNAQALLGEQAVVELIHTIGYYCHISLILNATKAALPPGETPTWPESPPQNP